MKQTSAYSIGVIISTYNNPAWLEKVLWGYLFQTHPADEIVIADDGSKEDTRRLIESLKTNCLSSMYGMKITASRNHES